MITVGPATTEALSFIGANLNDDDRREMEALTLMPTELVAASHKGEHASVAYHNKLPAAAFGFSVFMGSTWSAWMFGTGKSWRCVPEITEKFHEGCEVAKSLGCKRLEIRSIEGHLTAQGWMENSLGFSKACELPNFGLSGETFILFERKL